MRTVTPCLRRPLRGRISAFPGRGSGVIFPLHPRRRLTPYPTRCGATQRYSLRHRLCDCASIIHIMQRKVKSRRKNSRTKKESRPGGNKTPVRQCTGAQIPRTGDTARGKSPLSDVAQEVNAGTRVKKNEEHGGQNEKISCQIHADVVYNCRETGSLHIFFVP